MITQIENPVFEVYDSETKWKSVVEEFMQLTNAVYNTIEAFEIYGETIIYHDKTEAKMELSTNRFKNDVI